MTVFIIFCAVMLLAALVWTLLPLFRGPTAQVSRSVKEKGVITGVVAVLVSALAFTMYAQLSDWDFNVVAEQAKQEHEIDDMLSSLENRLKSNPTDVNGWMLLGRSYMATARYDKAVFALEHAHAAANGANPETAINLAEALTMVDQTALGGRAGELIETALTQAPNHPKALWYGAMAALQKGDLRVGRDRFQQLLAANPPDQIRTMVERQIQDLNQQLGEGGGEGGPAMASTAPPAPTAATPAQNAGAPTTPAGRALTVSVSIAPEIQKQLNGALPMFIAVRAPEGGPPLAAQRRSSTEAPFTVTLTERDAMMATRSIATAQQVQVVARLSKSGAPQAQSGDYFGQAEYDFAKGPTATLNVVINQVAP